MHTKLCKDKETLQTELFETLDTIDLRFRINKHTLQTTQTLLLATKGKGYMHNHIAARLYRQAHFFLVWSCPASVAQKHFFEITTALDQADKNS